jgi:Tol biopolymer transport system component
MRPDDLGRRLRAVSTPRPRSQFIDDDTKLRVRDVATGRVTSPVNVSGSERLRVIEFSPEGERILFSRTEDMDSGVSSLWSINANGSDLRRLVSRIEWADWRP